MPPRFWTSTPSRNHCLGRPFPKPGFFLTGHRQHDRDDAAKKGGVTPATVRKGRPVPTFCPPSPLESTDRHLVQFPARSANSASLIIPGTLLGWHHRFIAAGDGAVHGDVRIRDVQGDTVVRAPPVNLDDPGLDLFEAVEEPGRPRPGSASAGSRDARGTPPRSQHLHASRSTSPHPTEPCPNRWRHPRVRGPTSGSKVY